MPTFPRGHLAYLTRAENAAARAMIERLDAQAARVSSGSFEFPDPTDIRGIPAVGRGVGGCMRGTQPEAVACR